MARRLDPELVRPARFAHVVLRARDLEASIEWYRSVVGMEVVFRNELLAFLTYDEEHHRLALIRTPQQAGAPRGAAGLDHVAYAFDSLGDLLRTYKRLAAKGTEPVWSINHGPTTSLYYADPDGNRVEFLVDNFKTENELKSWMESGAFARNPIGVEFDPDRLAARYERGDPLERLLEQGAA